MVRTESPVAEMYPTEQSVPETVIAGSSRSLPARDFIILPLIALATILALFAVAEVTTRFFWSAKEQGYCMVFDPVAGPHGKPNCTTVVKIPEGDQVKITFNQCGYRSTTPCTPKPAGTYRVVLLGSSIAEGYPIADRDTLASRLVDSFRHKTGRPADLDNLGAEACPPMYAYRHMAEALSRKPDAIVLPINPWDMEQDIPPGLLAVRDDPKPITRAPMPEVRLSPIQKAQALLRDSRTMLVAQHFFLQNRDAFLKLYLYAGGDHTAFVRQPFTPAWQKRFEATDLLIGGMAAKARAAGVRLVIVGIPERAQTEMLSVKHLPPGIDPYAFTRRLGEIAAKHGAGYVDGLQVLAKAHDRSNLFYIVDGHPTPEAHRLLGNATGQLLSANP